MVWSKQQEHIFDWFHAGTGNLVVRARAGTGKTTTIIEGINRAPERRIVLAAFNKRIAEELSRRIANQHAEAKTLHALGFSFVRRYWGGLRVDSRSQRVFAAAFHTLGMQAPDEIVRMVATLCTKGREMLPLATDHRELAGLAAQFDCVPDDEWEEDGYAPDTVTQAAFDAMQYLAVTRDGLIDFADMLFLPVKNRWVKPWYDLVVIDEAQDMAGAQLLLAEQACGGRLAVVGDDRQAIYGFRGADSESIDRLKQAYAAHELPLTVTYRCPRSIVAAAAELVPDIEAAPGAPEGAIHHVRRDEMFGQARPGDFMLSRLNAPLAGICLRLLRDGVRARIEGRDIALTLLSRVRKFSKCTDSLSEVVRRFDRWLDVERTRATADADADLLRRQRAEDIVDTVAELCVGLGTVQELESRIDALFTDDPAAGARVVCSTVHKAKGLEARNVFLLRETFTAPWLRGREESNIKYVAITRAQERLVWVDDVETTH